MKLSEISAFLVEAASGGVVNMTTGHGDPSKSPFPPAGETGIDDACAVEHRLCVLGRRDALIRYLTTGRQSDVISTRSVSSVAPIASREMASTFVSRS